MTGGIAYGRNEVFVINLDEQEKDTGCAWFTLPCNIEALKQSIGLPPDSDRYLISDYDFPFEILQDTDLDLLNNVCLAISESEIPHEDIPAIQREWFSNLQELEAGLAILHTIGTVQIWKKHQNISYVCMADFMNTMSERK